MCRLTTEMNNDFIKTLLDKIDYLTALSSEQAQIISEQAATINKLTEITPLYKKVVYKFQ